MGIVAAIKLCIVEIIRILWNFEATKRRVFMQIILNKW